MVTIYVSSFLLYSRLRISFVSVVFDFSDSLNDVAPVYSMMLPVDVMRKEKSELLMDVICVSFFLLSSPFRLSSVSVVFDFSDSLNDVAPVSPMLLTVDVVRNGKSELLIGAICVSSFFCLHSTDRVQ